MRNFLVSGLAATFLLGACAHKPAQPTAPAAAVAPAASDFKWIGPIGDRITIQQESQPEVLVEFKLAENSGTRPFWMLVNGQKFLDFEAHFGRTPRREALISTSDYGPSFLILSEYMGDGCPVIYRAIRIENGAAHDLGQLGSCEEFKEIKLSFGKKGRPQLHISFGPREYLGRSTPAKTWKF